MGRTNEADSVALGIIDRERDGRGFRSRVRDVQGLYLRHGFGRRAGEVLARAGAGADDPDVLEQRARGLIRADDPVAAVPVLHALLVRGRVGVAATLLGDVYADGGGVPQDLEAAERWYEAAVQAFDAADSDARYERERARWRLCQLSLIARESGGWADAVERCGVVAAERSASYGEDGAFWSAMIHLDGDFDGADPEQGLSVLESIRCPPLGWITPSLYFRDEHAKALFTWASQNLELHVDRGRAHIELCLGRLYGRGKGAASPPFKPDRARDLLSTAAARGSTDALLELAQLVKRHYCRGGCTEQVRAIYRRATDMGEAWGHYYLAEIIVEEDADVRLPEALRHLDSFSTMWAKEWRESNCRRGRRDTSRHTAENIYQALEARLGYPVERTPDRGCL